MTEILERVIGRDVERIDARVKATGAAPYAFEQAGPDATFLAPLQATIARGRVSGVDATAALAVDGVLAVITHENAPRLREKVNPELWILQDSEVHYRGQFIGGVVAISSEIAAQAAGLVEFDYEVAAHDAEFRPDHPELYAPETTIIPSYPAATSQGDVEAGLAQAVHVVDETYTTPLQHHNPMEPHATVAQFEDGDLTLYESSQGVHNVRVVMAMLFGLDPERVHVISPYVGGGFGAKGVPHSNLVLAGLAATHLPGRQIRLALTRRQMFAVVGYRTPTIQRIRLGADADGRMTAISHDVIEQTSRISEFCEQTAICSRMMYDAPNRSTSHRIVPLDVPVPTFMRAPGETPGMFALEVAVDELAEAAGLDPIELRLRNEPEVDPENGKPWSSRNLVACYDEGARRFGWADRAPQPRALRRDGWWIGSGVASAVFPAIRIPGSVATIRHAGDGRYEVSIAAADIGTGAWTVLGQIAADALGVEYEAIDVRLGSTEFPSASIAGGSSGTASWGSTIIAAARTLRETHGDDPPAGASATEGMPDNPDAAHYAMYAFGAHFAEAAVHADTGEIRVPRMVSMFATGRIVNPRTARSQFHGGVVWGISMALHERSVIDPRFGHVINGDFAGYHVASNADIGEIEVGWVDEDDPHVNAMGAKGIGEVGIVGVAAAVANAVHHATGVRVRDLPITPDMLLT